MLVCIERQAYDEIPPRVEYKLTIKGQELVESLIDLYTQPITNVRIKQMNRKFCLEEEITS
jgi:DNA-binding HxlR family transcriptional regulator